MNTKNYPDSHHSQGGMKFATQISPLLNFIKSVSDAHLYKMFKTQHTLNGLAQYIKSWQQVVSIGAFLAFKVILLHWSKFRLCQKDSNFLVPNIPSHAQRKFALKIKEKKKLNLIGTFFTIYDVRNRKLYRLLIYSIGWNKQKWERKTSTGLLLLHETANNVVFQGQP